MISVDAIILAGGPRKASAAAVVGRPVWSLPIASGLSILDGWFEALELGFQSVPRLTLRRSVLLASEDPFAMNGRLESRIEIKPEIRPHRGTAGVVADELTVGDPEDDSLVLVIQASSSPVVDMAALVERAGFGLPEDCCGIIGESALGRFCGVTLCRRSIFHDVPTVGFYDLKEQLFPRLARTSASFQAACIADRARSIQTREGWLSIATDWANLYGDEDEVETRPSLRHRIAGKGCIIEPSARTDGATLVSSIVMDQATIEPGAVVARSVVGPGVTVKAGAHVIDSVLGDPVLAMKASHGLDTPRGEGLES